MTAASTVATAVASFFSSPAATSVEDGAGESAAVAESGAVTAGTRAANQKLAQKVADKYGGQIGKAAGDGHVVKINNMTLRVMNQGGKYQGVLRVNYFRISEASKGALDALGNTSSDRGLTHINIDNNSFETIC